MPVEAGSDVRVQIIIDDVAQEITGIVQSVSIESLPIVEDIDFFDPEARIRENEVKTTLTILGTVEIFGVDKEMSQPPPDRTEALYKKELEERSLMKPGSKNHEINPKFRGQRKVFQDYCPWCDADPVENVKGRCDTCGGPLGPRARGD